MLKWFMKSRVAGFARAYGYDTSYMDHMIDVSPTAFMRFAKVMGLSQHSEDTPADALYAAKLAALVSEDCGPCTQLVTQMAEQAGVSAEVLRGILTGDTARMGPDASLAWRFAAASLAHSLDADLLRAEIEQRWGPRAVLTLALAITSARLYPTLKYALGYGHACTRVRVAGADVVPREPVAA